MPTLIERLKQQASAIPIADLAGSVAGDLGNAIDLLEKLPNAPDEAAAGLLQALGNVPVPQLQTASRIGAQIANIAGHMPSDFSSATAAFDPILDGLQSALGGDLIPILRNFLDLAGAIDALTRFDLNAAASGSSGSPGSGAAGGSGSGTGSGATGGSGSAGGAGADSGSGSAGGADAVAGSDSGSGAGGSGSGGAGPGGSGPDAATQAARERRLAALAASRTALGNLPSPLDAPGLTAFLERLLTGAPRDQAKMRRLPFYDDMQQLLATVMDIRHKSEADLKTHISTSLRKLAAFLTGAFAGYLGEYGDRVAAYASAANIPVLQSDLAALRAALQPIAAALEARDLAGIGPQLAAANAALDSAVPRLAMLHSSVGRANLESLIDRTRSLPLDLERQMRQLVRTLEPANTFRFLSQAKEPLARAMADYDPETLGADLRSVLSRPLELLDLLEASGVQDALQAPTQAIDTLLQQMDAVMGQVASATAGLFDQVDRFLAQADPQALLQEAHQACETFRLALTAKAQELFAPVSQALEQGLQAIAGAVGSFDPASLIDSLKDFLDGVAGIFDTDPVKTALDALHDGIAQATEKIRAISFAPVTNAVEDEIQAITTALRAIDPAMLSTEAKLALTGAAALLPSDLDPVTDPLVDGFGKLVDEGPKQWLGFLSEKAALVKAEIEKFNPANLVGDALSKPFQDFLAQLQGLEPLALLEPLNGALADLRATVLNALDPAPALRPLQDAYDGLLAGFDSLDPARLLQPVEEAIHRATHEFREALPLDEIAGVLTNILDKLQHAFDLAAEARQSLEQAANLFAALEHSEDQLRTWLQPLLDRVAGFTDVSSLSADAAAVAAGVEQSKAAALAAAADAAWGPFRMQLESFAPGETCEALVDLKRRLRPDFLAAVPASQPEKAGLEALMARFDPVRADFGEPMRGLQAWLDARRDAAAGLTRTLSRWDARHHRPGGPVASLLLPEFTADAFKEVLRQSLEDEFIKPVGSLFEFVFQASQAGRIPLLEVVHFLREFQDRAEAMLTGSAALGGLRDGLLGLADRIENVNLGFLAQQLGEVFQAVKGKLDLLNPAHVGEEIRAALDAALGLLSVDLLLTDEAKTAIDEAYHGLIGDLQALDPKTILERAVQPVYDEKVKPNVLKVDLTPLLEAMLAKLEDLKGELRAELDEVNGKYKEMLDAIPKMDAGEAIGAAADAIGGAIGF